MKKTDTNVKASKIRIVVRFIYRNRDTPSCDVVEMDEETYAKFLRSESMTNRINMLLEILDKEYIWEIIRELAWIPLDDNMDLVVNKD